MVVKRILYLVVSYIVFTIINFLLLQLRIYNVELAIMFTISVIGNIFMYGIIFKKELKKKINIIIGIIGIVLSLMSVTSALMVDFIIIMNDF